MQICMYLSMVRIAYILHYTEQVPLDAIVKAMAGMQLHLKRIWLLDSR